MAETDLKKMLPAELVESLIKDNSLASEFDKLDLWKKFDSWKWSNLLSAQPQFADKCDMWYEFNYYNWEYVLSAQPQFAEKCDEYNGWEKMDSHIRSTLRRRINEFRKMQNFETSKLDKK